MTELIGHENIKRQLESVVCSNRIGHAYIFEGVDGIGKTTAAFWFAKLSVCLEKNGTPCGCCDNCKKADAGTHPDIVFADDNFIANSKIKSNSVDAMRIIKKDVYSKPFMADRKFYIIPDAEKLLAPAQNSLLKVFEEPPPYCTIILICENAQVLVQTIRSRAVTVRFMPLPDSDMRTYISRYSTDNIEKIISLSHGIPLIANSIVNDPDYIKEFDSITKAFSSFLSSSGDMTDVLQYITKDNADFAISCIENYINNIIENAISSDNTLSYINIFDILQNTRRKLKINCNFNLAIVDMLIKCREVIHG